MEKTTVLIVGAGPAGLTLGLALAKHEIHSVILEKTNDITQDPRGVFLAGDAVRILYDIGIGDQITKIGHQVYSVNFHKSTFREPPFFKLDTGSDALSQAVPDGILQIQPRLERALRDKVKSCSYCDLQCGAEVVSREETADGLIVQYKHLSSETLRNIRCKWLIGADGKTGIVRKHFLEKSAGVVQGDGLFVYNGTWVAANLKIRLPTPQTHPEFPLWKLNASPEDVYDLFWPAGWHFCSPPGKATASGRFGPIQDRYWRHEFAEPDWNESMDPIELLWEHLIPMVTRSHDARGRVIPGESCEYPRDCIEIKRCRPFKFQHKVVNKWFHKRTILIGDAAHVFPPFGGQGIACGIRDAHGLAWRLAILSRMGDISNTLIDRLLTTWALERRQGVDDSAKLTMANGKLANEPETWGFFFLRTIVNILEALPLLPKIPSPQVAVERSGYKRTKDGFYLSQFNGGGKLAQIYFRSLSESRILSDSFLTHKVSALTLIVLDRSEVELATRLAAMIHVSGLDKSILSEQSIVFFDHEQYPTNVPELGAEKIETYYPASITDMGVANPPQGYDEKAYMKRFEPSTKFAILRPDFIIFAMARDIGELEACMSLLKERLDTPPPANWTHL